MGKELTEADVTKLFHILTGRPVPELTEAKKEAREKARLQERAKWEIRQAREVELVEQLARAFDIPAPPSTSDADLLKLHRALTG